MTEIASIYWLRIIAKTKEELEYKYQELLCKLAELDLDYADLAPYQSKDNAKYCYSQFSHSFTDLKYKVEKNKPNIVQNKIINIAMLFTGQGAQLPFMGYELYQTQPIFKLEFDRCYKILKDINGSDLKKIIFNQDPAQLNDTGNTQPALFAYEYALAKLWQSWGISPTWVIGHSVGEYPAATIANYISLETGIKLIQKRAQLMQSLPAGGGMAAVLGTATNVQDYIQDYAENVEIAALNAPKQTVVAGSLAALDKLLEQLKIKRVKARKLVVSHAFHSKLMEPILAEFKSYVEQTNTNIPTAELISNVTGEFLQAKDLNSNYWTRHIREKVNFLGGLDSLAAAGANCFLEVGPQPFLLGMAAKTYDSSKDYHFISSRENNLNELLKMLNSAAELEQLGININWQNINIPEFSHTNNC